MIKYHLIKLANKWIARHKLRYLLSWVSFALVSIILVSIYSIGFNIQNSITDQLKVNPLNYQIHVRNMKETITDNKVTRDLSVKVAEDIQKEVNASGMRILFDSSLYLESIDDELVSISKGKTSFVDVGHSLLLDKDIEYLNFIHSDNNDFGFSGRLFDETTTNKAVVTSAFLESYDISTNEALGKKLIFTDEHSSKYEYQISGVLTDVEQNPILTGSYIYLPYGKDTEEKILSNIELALVTYDLDAETGMEDAMAKMTTYGYVFEQYDNNAEDVIALSNSFKFIGAIVAIILLSISSIGLANSILVTINENAPFMNFFRIIGLTRNNYYFIVAYTATLQGIVGGIIGCILSLVFQSQIYGLFKLLNIGVDDFIHTFRVDPRACVYAMLFCIVISLLTSIISFIGIRRNAVIHGIHSELIFKRGN